MKSVCVKSMMALLTLVVVSAATPVLALHVMDLEVMGSGTVETNCLVTLASGCTVTSSGEAMGTHINHGYFVLRLDTGSPASLNGYPAGPGPQGGTQQGVCLPASFLGGLSAASGDTINFRHAGVVCEEAAPGSSYHYNGTYRITGGTGQFAAAVGGGSLTSTFTRDGATAFFHLQGTIKY